MAIDIRLALGAAQDPMRGVILRVQKFLAVDVGEQKVILVVIYQRFWARRRAWKASSRAGSGFTPRLAAGRFRGTTIPVGPQAIPPARRWLVHSHTRLGFSLRDYLEPSVRIKPPRLD
jgi:hypothetical protein